MRILFCIFSVSFVSCVPPAYFPSQTIPPLISKQGNVQASVGVGSSYEYKYQLAASPINYVSLVYGGLNTIPKSTNYKHSYNEFGGGLYFHITEDRLIALYSTFSKGSVNAKSGKHHVENNYDQWSAILVSDEKSNMNHLTGAVRIDYHQMHNYLRYDVTHSGGRHYFIDDKKKNIFIGPSGGYTFPGTSTLQVNIGATFPLHKSERQVYVYASAAFLFDMQF